MMKFLKIIGKRVADKWMDYVKNDVLCTAFSYARYSKGMEEITEFGMKNSLTLPSLGWKYFNSLRERMMMKNLFIHIQINI